MLERLSQLNNQQIIYALAIAVVALLLMIILLISVSSTRKKKKCYRVLDRIRARIVHLKQRDVIKNYASYDHLKNDKKLGMLVVRWKKSIESLVQEIDAQFSLIDVLEDAIESRKYKNFYSLAEQVESDVETLENRANELDDEMAEYIDQASDNRKYINKYREMFNEFVQTYRNNMDTYRRVMRPLEKMIREIEGDFDRCQEQIDASRFDEADRTASRIFEAIKTFDHYLEEIPEIQQMIKTTIEPKFEQFLSYFDQFTLDELNLLDESLIHEAERFQKLKEKIERDLVTLNLETIRDDIIRLENFLDHNNGYLSDEHSNKEFIDEQINYQKEYVEKIEKSARNFVSLFKVVQFSYDENDLQQIESMLVTLERLKEDLKQCEDDFANRNMSFETIKDKLDISYRQLENLSKSLDEKVKIVDHIYRNEKTAREKLKQLTEKINGTKKFIKVAHLMDVEKDLQTITDLNAELSDVYLLLSEFPIDIVKLNHEIDAMTHKVEETTKTINNKIYKAMLTEFAIVYGNRYYSNEAYREDLLKAEQSFYQQNYTHANDVIMELLERIDSSIKREVIDRFQEKFQAIFQ